MGISALVATALTSLGVGAETAGVLAPIISSGAIGGLMSGVTGQPILKGIAGGALMGGIGSLFSSGAGAIPGSGATGTGVFSANPNGAPSAAGFSMPSTASGIGGDISGAGTDMGAGSMTGAALAGARGAPGGGVGGGVGSPLVSGISRGLNGNNGTIATILALGNMLTQPKPQTPSAGATFNQPFNTTGFLNRSRTSPSIDYAHAGEGPEPTFFNDNHLTFPQTNGTPQGFSRGGALRAGGGQPFSTRTGQHYVAGGSAGQDDDEDAKLSDGEFVMDAGTVSRLGDGNSEAGARRMEQIRHAIAQDTGAKHVVQKPARDPIHYVNRAQAA